METVTTATSTAAAAAAAGVTMSAAAASSSHSNATWTKCYSEKHKQFYFYNEATQESSWTVPAGYVEESAEAASADNLGHSTSGSSSARNGAEAGGVPTRKREADSAFQAPVSGSATDYKHMKVSKLSRPIITAALPPSKEDMWTRTDIEVNSVLAQVYKTGTITDQNGEAHKFRDCTNPIQGRHLYNLIKDNGFTRTLEVGLAMGASAVWICQAHADVGVTGSSHIALDPNQTAQYRDIGAYLVERAGLARFMTVIQLPSYRAMPQLLEEIVSGKRERFHLIYIDGWHTFDYTLVDFFYADLMLEENGIIVLDDIKHLPVKKFLDYVVTNYPHYELVKHTPCYSPTDRKISSQATFIKLESDKRVWNHHAEF
jgi:predicted O-methyltransferase YrrM